MGFGFRVWGPLSRTVALTREGQIPRRRRLQEFVFMCRSFIPTDGVYFHRSRFGSRELRSAPSEFSFGGCRNSGCCDAVRYVGVVVWFRL